MTEGLGATWKTGGELVITPISKLLVTRPRSMTSPARRSWSAALRLDGGIGEGRTVDVPVNADHVTHGRPVGRRGHGDDVLLQRLGGEHLHLFDVVAGIGANRRVDARDAGQHLHRFRGHDEAPAEVRVERANDLHHVARAGTVKVTLPPASVSGSRLRSSRSAVLASFTVTLVSAAVRVTAK